MENFIFCAVRNLESHINYAFFSERNIDLFTLIQVWTTRNSKLILNVKLKIQIPQILIRFLLFTEVIEHFVSLPNVICAKGDNSLINWN